MNTKTIHYVWLHRLLLLLMLSGFIAGCQDDTSTTQSASATNAAMAAAGSTANAANLKPWTEWVKTYPQGILSRTSPVLITFRQPLVAADQVGKPADTYISISPAVTGKATFDTESSITFTPEKALNSNQTYTVNLKPNGLLNIPTDLAPIELSFKTPPLELDVQTDGLVPSEQYQNQMKLSGTLYTSDYAEDAIVEKALQATVQNKTLPLAWQHNGTGTEHRFTINAIPRETFATELALAWDGAGLNATGTQSKGQKTVAIPSQKTFSITRIQTERNNDNSKPYVSVTFSDLLNPSQDLTGLVQLGSDKIRTQIIGNRIDVFPSDELEPGEYKLVLNSGIQAANASLGKLPNTLVDNVRLEPPKPAVRFVGKGSILPDNQVLEIPIEVQAVNAVQVTAFEIYPENIPQFLQTNNIHGDSDTGRVGRYLWRKTIPVKVANPNQWNRFTLDATQLLKTKPGTLYRLELSIDRRHSAFNCPAGTPAPAKADAPLKNYEDDGSSQASGWDGIEDYYINGEGSSEYDWDKRTDPCQDSYYYYNDDKVKGAQNFLASNLGLIAKQEGNGTLHVIATDLRTATPANGVQLTVRNYQGQTIVTGTTDDKGFATIQMQSTPFLLVAKQANDTGYLKLNANSALAVSQFDVGGENLQKGLKGVLYGERGVWRPGDDIHMTFALQDRAKTLPANHPVTVQLIDPMGKVKQVQTNKTPVGPFYTFTLRTSESDQTGNWLVKANLGASTFDKTIKIETVRPNRLKIDLSYGTEALYGYDPLPDGKLFAQWLHGGKARNLKADVSVRLREKTTSFGRFGNYTFDDPTRKMDSEEQQLVDGRLDAEGYLTFNKSFQPEEPAPGMLSAWFTSRVHEEGGGFSIAKQEMDYYPFKNYVGISLPKGDAERGMLLTDETHPVEIATVDAKGNEVSLPQVQVTLYKVEWKWWWDKTPESLAEYSDASHSSKIQQSVISTTNGRGTWNFQVKYPDWGRYLIRACDLDGKHCAGKTVYVDWPGWAGRAQEDGSGAAAMLRFASDKDAYKVGETAKIQLPEATKGRALLTVENASQILDQRWLELNGERAQIDVPITDAMAPNVYVSISLLQPHQNKTNDRPIRLYGIIPLKVENPNTLLTPVINAAEEWKPTTPQTFTVSEQNGKPMSYTLAVVDEGLLGLTKFETPDLHKSFYRKEALGIKTWDLFDDVIGAYGGQLERMLALGGGDEAQIDDAANKPKRFPPVVKFLGAFTLEAGQTREHQVELPPYLGAVRIMLVAAQDQAYGKAEKPVFVRQPVMMLSSLPRTLKTNETVEVPLTVFVGKPDIKQVTVTVQGNPAFVALSQPITVNFDGPGEKVIMVPVKTGAIPMAGQLQFTATSGTETSQQNVDIAVQAPNLPSIRSVMAAIEPRSTWSPSITPHGLAGTNESTLEVSAIPGLNLDQHLDYLVHYPHGCLEQTTSAAFPQLYLPKLLNLPAEQQQKVERHIKAAIDKIGNFQAVSGNLMYWPGSTEANDWSSLYAGNFLIEAQKQGYAVPTTLLTNWALYQTNLAQEWVNDDKLDTSHIQAYRLYVLALGGKPQLGAMNRLRESGKANTQARWLLAAAYQQVGQAEAAAQVVQGLSPAQAGTPTPDLTFSGKLGNLGIQLETLLALNKTQDAEALIQQMAVELAVAENANTHDLSWALMSIAHYLGQSNQAIKGQLSIDGAAATVLNSAQSLLSQQLAKGDVPFKVALTNEGDRKLYATVYSKGIAPAGNEMAEYKGLTIHVDLFNSAKELVWSTQKLTGAPLQLAHGQDYNVVVHITNDSPKAVKHVALSTLVPSGVEIGTPAEAAKVGLSYQDVRDDRVLSYFDMKAGERKTVTIPVNAAFLGEYYFPAVSAEVMYEPNKRGRTAGVPVQIVKTVTTPILAPAPVEPVKPEPAKKETSSTPATNTESAPAADAATSADTTEETEEPTN